MSEDKKVDESADSSKESVQDIASDVASIVTPEDSDLLAIKEKYKSDPDELAKAYKGLQSKQSKLENDSRVPDEYKIDSKIPDSMKKRLTDAAKVLKMTQPQFDSYASNFMKAQQDISVKRLDAAGGEEGVKKLKAFFEGKMPKAALENILNNGDIDAIKELRKMRDDSFSSESDKIGSPDMTNNSNQVDPAKLKHEKDKKDKELRDLIFKRYSPKLNAMDVEALDREIKEKAIESAAIKKKIKDGVADSLEFM